MERTRTPEGKTVPCDHKARDGADAAKQSWDWWNGQIKEGNNTRAQRRQRSWVRRAGSFYVESVHISDH